jgi:hypothetical protein
VSLQRSPAAPYRPQTTSLRTIPLRRSSGHCTQASAGPSLRFSSPRVSASLDFAFETPPGLIIHGRRLSPAYRIRPGLLSRPGRASYTRRRSWGSADPFAVLLRPAGWTRLVGPSVAHLPFRLRPTAPFTRRGHTRSSGVPRVSGRGFWALASRASRAVSFADPAMAFMHRVARTHRPGLPWVFVPLSGVRRWPRAFTSEGRSARGL